MGFRNGKCRRTPSEYPLIRYMSDLFTPKVTDNVFIGFLLKRNESEAV